MVEHTTLSIQDTEVAERFRDFRQAGAFDTNAEALDRLLSEGE